MLLSLISTSDPFFKKLNKKTNSPGKILPMQSPAELFGAWQRAKTDQGVLAQRFVFTSRQTAVPLLWDLSSGSSGQESGQCVQAGPVMSHRSQRLISGGKVSQRRAFTKPKIASAKTSPNSPFSGLDQSVFVCSYFMNSPVAFLFLNLYTVVIANDLSQQTLQLISFLWCKQLKGIWLNNIQLD